MQNNNYILSGILFCFGICSTSTLMPPSWISTKHRHEKKWVGFHFPTTWILPSIKTPGRWRHPGPGIRWPIPEDRKSDVVFARMPTSAGRGLGISLNTTPSWLTVMWCTQQQTLTQSTGVRPHAYSAHTHTGSSMVLLICLAHCTCSTPQDLARIHIFSPKSQRFGNILGRQQLNW